MDTEEEVVENYIKPLLEKAVEDASAGILTKKSKQRYDRTFNEFELWRKRNDTISLAEDTLLAYFESLSESNKPPTLWAYYSMLKSTLNVNHGVDISTYVKLLAFLKKQAHGYRPKKAKLFTEDEMRSFILNAPDNEWLAVKVACVFGLCGALRADELVKIDSNDVKMYDDMACVRISNSKNKESRSFAVTGDLFATVKKYTDLRPPKVFTNRFFLNYLDGRCTGHVIGKHKFSKMPSQVAAYLKLEEADKYKGNSFRLTSATTTETMRMDDWGSSSIAEHYIDDSLMLKHLANDMDIKDELEEHNSEDENSDDSMMTNDISEIHQAFGIQQNPSTNDNPEIHQAIVIQQNPPVTLAEETPNSHNGDNTTSHQHFINIESPVTVKVEPEEHNSENSRDSIIATENPLETNQPLVIQRNPTVNLGEEPQIPTKRRNYCCGDVNINITSHDLLEFTKSADGQITAKPFNFNNCNVTINYYQK